MGLSRWLLAHKTVSLPLGAVVVAAAGGGAYVATSTSSPGGIAAPVAVSDTYTDGSATVTWRAPAGTAVTGYRVTLYPTLNDRVPAPSLGANGGMVRVAVGPGTTRYTFSNLLADCHQRYDVSVQTMTAGGESAPVFTPSFRPSGTVVPGQDPPYVVVLVDGILSQAPGFTMNPYAPNTGAVHSYCPESWTPGGPTDSAGTEGEADFATAPNGPWSFFHKWNVGEINGDGTANTSNADQEWESEPKSLTGGGGTNSFTHTFMLDALAATGAIILPFSYHMTSTCDPSTGAYLSGSRSDPTFHFPGYSATDSGGTACQGGVWFWGQMLGAELHSIHNMWPSAKLVVIGHSQGGLVVTKAWQQGFNLNTADPPAQIQAFSLDSPINGSCGTPGCIGPPSYPDYTQRGTYDEGSGGYLGMDASRGNNMHFIGTYGDSPLILGFRAYGTGAETLEHQMPFDYLAHTSDYIEAHCYVEAGPTGGWPQVHSTCPAPDPPDYVSPCPVDFNTVAPWITDTGHFVVKYCPGVIDYVNQEVGLSQATPPPAQPDEVAVLGDSYASGEGSGDWIPPTGDGDFATGAANTCHRSKHAYAVTVLNADIFVACSGATSGDMEQTYRGQTSQVAALPPGAAVKTVVLSAGGDDAGFASVLTDCTSYLGSAHLHHTLHPALTCAQAISAAETGGPGFEGFPAIKTALVGLYDAILGQAAQAHLYVVGYPQLFPPQGFNGCNGITASDQVLLNNADNDLNTLIRGAVHTVNAQTGRVSFVDVTTVTTDHWICGNPWPNAGYINDLQTYILGPVGNLNCRSHDVASWQAQGVGICSKSYHPNQDGTKAIGQRVQDCIKNAATCDPSQQSWSCTAQTFTALLANPNEPEVTPAGTPKCLDGYAVMSFTIPNGQAEPFFFSFTAGQWVLVEGGDAVPTKACAVIPHQVMSAWGYDCSAGTTGAPPSPSGSTSVTPGHGSPAAAVAGLYDTELAGDWTATTGACSYVQPDAQAVCAAAAGGQGRASGTFQIHATVTQGTEALVEVTGSISAPGSPTITNTDPASGMPGSGADFQSVFDDLTNSAATVLSPAPCLEVGGQWYADVGG